MKLVKYFYSIKDMTRQKEIMSQVQHDVGKLSILAGDDDNEFIVLNYESDPDNGDDFIYGYEWEEKFNGALKLKYTSH
jgi:hypothetical protein